MLFRSHVNPDLTQFQIARDAFEAALADAALTLTPREVVCEAIVPLAALVRGMKAVELGVAKLCGVRFSFSARRDCSCATKSHKSSASFQRSSQINGFGHCNACSCGIICEATVEPMQKALGELYNTCGARARVVDDLVPTEDDDNDTSYYGRSAPITDNMLSSCVSRSLLNNNGLVSPATSPILVLCDVSEQFATVASTFGHVNANFTLYSADNNQASAECKVWLTQDPKHNTNGKTPVNTKVENPRKASVVLSLPAALNKIIVDYEASNARDNGTLGNAGVAVRVRCAVSFPDVMQQSRALQMYADAMDAEGANVPQACTDSGAAKLAAMAEKLRIAEDAVVAA